MSKHEIEVEGLPEGWEPVAFRMAHNDEHRVINGIIERCDGNDNCESLIVKKKQPRRIVLEEADEKRPVTDSEWYQDGVGSFRKWSGQGSSSSFKIWREVKETEETKLCLSVEECKSIIECDFVDVVHKVKKFLININKTS